MRGIVKYLFISAALMLAILLILPGSAFACERCFGANVDTPTTQGIAFSMLALLGITGGVSTGIVLFFLNIRKRSKMLYEASKEKLKHSSASGEVLNRLLDKINRSGYASLTTNEKELLKKVSRNQTSGDMEYA